MAKKVLVKIAAKATQKVKRAFQKTVSKKENNKTEAKSKTPLTSLAKKETKPVKKKTKPAEYKTKPNKKETKLVKQAGKITKPAKKVLKKYKTVEAEIFDALATQKPESPKKAKVKAKNTKGSKKSATDITLIKKTIFKQIALNKILLEDTNEKLMENKK